MYRVVFGILILFLNGCSWFLSNPVGAGSLAGSLWKDFKGYQAVDQRRQEEINVEYERLIQEVEQEKKAKELKK
jgi:hypothetical protein